MVSRWFQRREPYPGWRLSAVKADSAEGPAHERLARYGIELEAVKPDEWTDQRGHRFRVWRFRRIGAWKAYCQWWPSSGKWNSPDRSFGETEPLDFDGMLDLAIRFESEGMGSKDTFPKPLT